MQGRLISLLEGRLRAMDRMVNRCPSGMGPVCHTVLWDLLPKMPRARGEGSGWALEPGELAFYSQVSHSPSGHPLAACL